MKRILSSALMLGIHISSLSQIDAVKNNITEPLSQYVITPNTLKTNTGRLLLNFPDQTVWTIYVYKMGDDNYITSYSHTNTRQSSYP